MGERAKSNLASMLLATAVLCAAAPVAAAPCGRPDVDITFPPSGSTAVPVNAMFAAHYAAPALYDGEPVSLLDGSGNELPLDTLFDEAESMLRVVPQDVLEPGDYELVWPGLRGVSGTGLGRGSTTSFTVKGQSDGAPPTFAGIEQLHWDLSRDQDPCLDGLQDRFVFDLRLAEAVDDSDPSMLAVVVFETVDPLNPSATTPEQVAIHALPEGGMLEVRRPARRSGKTCFAALVRDLVGNVSGGADRELCVSTRDPPFFEGCALGAPRESQLGFVGLGLGLLTLARARRRVLR